LGVIRFYPGNSDPICQSIGAKPFGFDSSVLGSGFPLLLPSNGVSPHPFHLSMPVKMPVSNLDCDAILHP
jgi:hypothetical protein